MDLRKNRKFCEEGDFFEIDSEIVPGPQRNVSNFDMMYCISNTTQYRFTLINFEKDIKNLAEGKKIKKGAWYSMSKTRDALNHLTRTGSIKEADEAKVAQLLLLGYDGF